MKKVIISFLLVIFSHLAFGQVDTNQLISDGKALHRQKDYKGAIAKYDAILMEQPNHEQATYEKSYSLMELKQYDEALKIIKKLLKVAKEPQIRRLSYVNYGTILDYQGDKKNAIKKYEEGIKEFPQSYLLYFNKGITEIGMGNADDATSSFKNSVRRNPMHASSHNALGILVGEKNRIPGIFSKFCFLLIEPEGNRAKLNLDQLDKLIMKGVSRQDDKNVTISLDPSVLDKKKSKEDDFSSAELMLSLLAASVPDSLKTDADKMSHQLTTLIAIIDETNKKDKGFYKNFYVPFFVELKKKDFVTTACYVALTSSGKDDILGWQQKNKQKLTDFFDWFLGYKWAGD